MTTNDAPDLHYLLEGPEDAPQLVCLLRFPDDAAREAAWKAFRADSQWGQIKEQTEADGPLVESITAQVLKPTVFSPMR